MISTQTFLARKLLLPGGVLLARTWDFQARKN